LKGSYKLSGTKHLINIVFGLPFNIGKIMNTIMSEKITLAYTNMPSNKVNYDYGFAKCLCLNAFIPSVGDIGLGVAVLSHGKLMNFSIVCDTH
jgi:hypothetical protein